MKDEKDLGATPQRSREAGSIEVDAAPHVAHTPGPWKVFGSAYKFVIARPIPNHKPMICEAPDSEPETAEERANVNLIAAAPDLLAVLRDLEWIGLNDGRGVTHVQCPACFALQSRGTGHNQYCGLAAAIAKAENRS